MTVPAANVETPANSHNVRLVVVDAHRQPTHLKRADQLQGALLAAAAQLGIQQEDMPGLHGLCIEAIRTAEIHNR